MNLKNRLAIVAITGLTGLAAIVAGCTQQAETPTAASQTISRDENALKQLNEAQNALSGVSRLTVESYVLDKKVYDKARYETIVASIDKALAELSDLENLTFLTFPNVIGQEQFSVKDASGAGTSYLYLPGDLIRSRDVLTSVREGYVQKIGKMRWNKEYLPPALEEVLAALGVTNPVPEAVEESVKPQHNVPAKDVFGKTRTFNQAQLILDSTYFLPYINKPIPVDVSPEPIPANTFSLAPFSVDTSCLGQRVNSFQGTIGIGIAPRVEDGKLYGFAVWAEVLGAGYSFMDNDILQLGKACEVTAK